MLVLSLPFMYYLTSAVQSTLYDVLDSLTFRNSGTIQSTDVYDWRILNASLRGGTHNGQVAIYLEAENVSCTQCVWSDGGKYYIPHPYLFKIRNHSVPNVTKSFQELSSYDWTQGDIDNGNKYHTPSEDDCKARCMQLSNCMCGLWLSGSVRHGECWLSSRVALVPRKDFCHAEPNQECKSFKKLGSSREILESPPSGVRSGVPLGGLSTGSVELRGDGTLREWIIHNAGPHGAAKIQQYPHAFFAAKVGDMSRILQTHPDPSLLSDVDSRSSFAGVSSIKYQGSYPFARLQFDDFETTEECSVSLYGLSSQSAGNMTTSARPAVAFVLTVDNHGSAAKNVSFSFNLPFAVEIDQSRRGTKVTATTAPDAASCSNVCAASKTCASWLFEAASGSCTLQKDAPLNRYEAGMVSGIASEWQQSPTATDCLTNTREGTGPMHGDLTLCASSASTNAAVSVSAHNDARVHWRRFRDTGSVASASQTHGAGSSNGDMSLLARTALSGAVSVTTQVPGNSHSSLVITMGWNFEHRDHYNYSPQRPFAPFGNKYAQLYPESLSSAWGKLTPAARETAVANMAAESKILQDALFAQPVASAFTNSHIDTNTNTNTSTALASLPEWLQDLLVNSVSHSRDSMWWQDHCPHCAPTLDPRVNASTFGIFRQYEAYDCPDLDSIHNDGERHVPYMMLFPNAVRSKLAAWAHNQGANGMLAEQILNKDPDSPQGRVMSDGSSMFLMYVLELLRWTGDRATLELYYPVVKKVAQWQMKVSVTFGVPVGLETTYDILRFPSYTLSAYASVFHLLAMAATRELATAFGDTAFASEANQAFARAQTSMDALQWNADGGYYHAGSSQCDAKTMTCAKGEGVFADSFYAQVLAYTSGLGDLLKQPERLDSHLRYVWQQNCVHTNDESGAIQPGCLNGLVIMTKRPVELTDLQVWEMATHNHVSLLLHRKRTQKRLGQQRQAPSPSLEDILGLSEGTGTSYSQRINDQWNVAGIKTNDGFPSITSHYGYHMVAWHTPFAVTGQIVDLSGASKSVSFDPLFTTCVDGGAGYAFPVLLPGVVGVLTCHASSGGGTPSYTLLLSKGTLQDISTLMVSGVRYPKSPVDIVEGVALKWA